MKTKLTKKQINDIVEYPERDHEASVRTEDSWWVTVLKIIAYVIGLVLGGAATTSCSAVVLAML